MENVAHWISTFHGSIFNMLLLKIDKSMSSIKFGLLLYNKLNRLQAEFFRENINIHLNFMPFLHINMAEAVEILPQVI